MTGSEDRTARLWDARTGKHLDTLRGHTGWVLSVAFSPDGRRLASASQDQTVRLWDATTGAALAVLHGHTSVCGQVRYTDDGATLVAAGDDGSVRLWDAQRAERSGVLSGHTDFVYDVAFHPDGARVASASWDGTVRLRDATTGRTLWSFHAGSGAIAPPAVANGVVYFGSGSQEQVYALNAANGRELRSFNVNDGPNAFITSSPAIAGSTVYLTAGLLDAFSLR